MRSIIYPIHRTLVFSLCVFSLIVCCSAQQIETIQSGAFHTVRFELSSADSIVLLPHQFIILGSETVLLDSLRLQRDENYSLQSRTGTIVLHKNLQTQGNMSGKRKLMISYRALPFTFQQSYRHREPVTMFDSVINEQIKVAKPVKPFTFDDFFGSNLQKSGSIVRGLTIGSNRDLSLNSGFRMQMSGNLTNDLQVIAALTDENTPIQPEGTTQTLQEVDKVFVELRSPDVSATLGDFNLAFSGNEFGRLNRKLQGARGQVKYRVGDIDGDATVIGAITRGKFTTNQFQGIDGVQGPYRIFGQNNERAIIIIAGTERVYVNGERMTRGEINDYVIDYSTAEVTFTSKRLITNASRITIDFEYADRQFSRSLLGAKVASTFFNNRLVFHTSVIKESDDRNSPIDASLSDVDKDTLQFAGDNRSKAVRSSATYVGSGKGQYILQDTAIYRSPGDSVRVDYYRFAPEDTLRAVYAVSFSFVGEGRGDYKKVTLSQYEFVGINMGGYAPVRFLPLPQSTILIDFGLDAKITDEVRLSGEYALSNFDANSFSSLDDDENRGSAVKFEFQFAPRNLSIANKNLGSVDIRLRERYVARQFVSFDRFNEIEFNRKWNIQDSTKVDEEVQEGTISYSPSRSITLGGGIGAIHRGDLFTSNRYTGSLQVNELRFPKVTYDLEIIKSRNSLFDNVGKWTKHRGSLIDTIGNVLPSFNYEGEIFRSRDITRDTLRRESFRYHEVVPGISLQNIAGMSINAQFGWRWEDSLKLGALQRASMIFTQSYHWGLQALNSLSSNLDVTLRDRMFTEQFKRGTDDHVRTALLRWQTRFVPPNRGVESDWYYEASSERSAKQERVYQRVPRGTGNYVYAGDLNSNHVIDAQDFQLARFDGDFIAITIPTDEFIPIIDVKASTRFRINGSRLISPTSWITKGLSYLSTETYVRIEEKSTESDTRQIYLLHFSKFLSDQTTITGSNLITQDLHVLEGNPAFSCRFRFLQKRGLTQYAIEKERAFSRERSIKVRWQLIKEFSNQTDYVERIDNLATTQNNNRTRSIISNTVSTDWSYRPEQNIEIGFKFAVGKALNTGIIEANINEQSVRCVYSITEHGQAKFELEREEVTYNKAALTVPFELTNGRVLGKTWLWRIGAEYQFTRVMQGSLIYDGRREGESNIVHTAKAEVRAFF